MPTNNKLPVGSGVDLLVTGDMGIGNTTPAAALVSAFTGRSPEETTGRGTGIDDETLSLKRSVVEEALALHEPDPDDPLGVLTALGGFEHAAIAGVILAGAAAGVPVVLDGVISNSVALVAQRLAPHSPSYLFAGRLGRAGRAGRPRAPRPPAAPRGGDRRPPGRPAGPGRRPRARRHDDAGGAGLRVSAASFYVVQRSWVR